MMRRSEMLVLFVMFLSCTQGENTTYPNQYSNVTRTNMTTSSIERHETSQLSTTISLESTDLSNSSVGSSVSPPPASSKPPSVTASSQTNVLSSAVTRTSAAATQKTSVSSAPSRTTTGGSVCVSASSNLILLLLSASCILVQCAHT
ncbi:hypothetical protein ILYODFUR_021876 [Ilyodon furcidens]|uniref:Uncharacterized protein n=1 Tax=Ilyodon furcidens TaxID=33524 RepID=A0ABV0VG71_9TELE